jgi:hypothetical protein
VVTIALAIPQLAITGWRLTDKRVRGVDIGKNARSIGLAPLCTLIGPYISFAIEMEQDRGDLIIHSRAAGS